MTKHKISGKVDWTRKTNSKNDLERVLAKFRFYLQEKGFRDATIEGYVGNVSRYLKFVQTEDPSEDDFIKFRESLHSWKMSRSTLNQYGYAIKAYHEMIGRELKYTRIKMDNQIPYYFTSEDVEKIFSKVNNIKHLAMLQTLFYGCLRASELCNLNDEDLDLNSLTVRIVSGKGGRDGITYINNTCASTIREYLQVRPPFLIDGQQPLFYTDFGHRWRREDLHHILTTYKKKAGIEKRGGVHVFGRHTPATLMISQGCDIRIVQQLLRHRDIRTTLRYVHLSDQTKRKMYEEYMGKL
jgi:integrase/recombinase XerD